MKKQLQKRHKSDPKVTEIEKSDQTPFADLLLRHPDNNFGGGGGQFGGWGLVFPVGALFWNEPGHSLHKSYRLIAVSSR